MQRLAQFVNDNIMLIAFLLLVIGFILCKNNVEFMTNEKLKAPPTNPNPLALVNLVNQGTNIYLKCKVKEKNEKGEIIEVPYYLGSIPSSGCQGLNAKKDCENYVSILKKAKDDSTVFKLYEHYGDNYDETLPEHEKSYLLARTVGKKQYYMSQKLKTDFDRNMMCFDSLNGFKRNILQLTKEDEKSDIYTLKVTTNIVKRDDNKEIIRNKKGEPTITGTASYFVGVCRNINEKKCIQASGNKYRRLCLFNSSITYAEDKNPILAFQIVKGPEETDDAKNLRLVEEATAKEAAIKEAEAEAKEIETVAEVTADPIASNDESSPDMSVASNEAPVDNAAEHGPIEPFTVITATGRSIFL